MTKPVTTLAVGTLLTLVPGCAGGPRDPGINDAQQDEFRIVTMAPLTVPPDYSLRPPRPGQSRPVEAQAERTQVTDFGTASGQNASVSERALVEAADANAVSPVIRAEIDYDEAGMIRKSSSIADRVMFWRDSEEARETAAEDSATGGEEVVIERARSGTRLKLPGT